MVDRSDHGDLPGLAGRGHSEIGTALCPGPGQIGVGQRLALIGKQQHDVAGLGLCLAQLKPQADPRDRLGVLAVLQAVPWPSPAEVFLRSTLDSCEREMLTPSRRAVSPDNRASVQLGRSATAP